MASQQAASIGALVPRPPAAAPAPAAQPAAQGDEEGPGSEGSWFSPDEVRTRNTRFTKPDAADFQTKLPPEQEAKFVQWVKQNKVPFDPTDKTPDYDMRGFFLAQQNGDKRASNAVNPNDGRVHYPDFWKTPYGLTFSNESQWANDKAPAWNEKDQLVTPDGEVVYDERNRAAYIGRKK